MVTLTRKKRSTNRIGSKPDRLKRPLRLTKILTILGARLDHLLKDRPIKDRLFSVILLRIS